MRISVFLLFFPFLLHAQSNFKKGYVVTIKGDTLDGYINYRDRAQNPNVITFKKHLEQKDDERFDVQNANAFAIYGYETYERFITLISMDEIRLNRLSENVDSASVTDTVFLQTVVTGDKVNLYSYKDQIKERFYVFEKGDDAPTELGYKAFVKDGNEVVLTQFKQQLIALAIKNGVLTESLNNLIQTSQYVKRHLEKILSHINTVSKNDYSGTLEKKKRIRFFAGAGLYYNTLKYTGNNFVTINKLDQNGNTAYKDEVTTHSVLPRFSAGLDYYLKPAFERYLIRLEMFTSPIKSKVTSYYKYGAYLDDELENTYQFSTVLLSISPQFIYNLYNQEQFKFYIGAGGAYTYAFTSKNTMHKKPNKQGIGYVEVTEDDYFNMAKKTTSLIMRSGIVFKRKFDLSLLWMTPLELTKTYHFDYARIEASSMYLSIGYVFGKKSNNPK